MDGNNLHDRFLKNSFYEVFFLILFFTFIMKDSVERDWTMTVKIVLVGRRAGNRLFWVGLFPYGT